MNKPAKVYHGSSFKIEGALRPVLKKDTSDHIHERPALFATERADVAALFMFPMDYLASIGFEQDIAYICIWGTPEELSERGEVKGYLYILPGATFEKVGKGYEWQSFEEVIPLEVKEYTDVVSGMMEWGVQVYFINSDPVFDKIVADKDHRAAILKELASENQKQQINIKIFS